MSQILEDSNVMTRCYHDDFDYCNMDQEDSEINWDNNGDLWDKFLFDVDKKRCEVGLKFERHTYNYTTKNLFFLEKSGGMKYKDVVSYYKIIAEKLGEIQLDSNVLSGMPVIKNTRIPVSLILYCLKDEMSIEEICDSYKLSVEDVEGAMVYAIELLDAPFQDDEE